MKQDPRSAVEGKKVESLRLAFAAMVHDGIEYHPGQHVRHAVATHRLAANQHWHARPAFAVLILLWMFGTLLTWMADHTSDVFVIATSNLSEFFQRFRSPNVRSSQQLVEQSQRIVRGIAPQSLRDNQFLRQQVAAQLSGMQSVLDGMMVDRPRRPIVRSGAQAEAS